MLRDNDHSMKKSRLSSIPPVEDRIFTHPGALHNAEVLPANLVAGWEAATGARHASSRGNNSSYQLLIASRSWRKSTGFVR